MTLIIAGLGVKFLSHLTKETEVILKHSDKVFYLANNDMFSEWIDTINKNNESLYTIYFSTLKRNDSYNLIKDKIISELKTDKIISFVVYGHPTFLVQITSLLKDATKTTAHKVHLLPGISSFDCLLADLCINPGDGGMQLLEASELLSYQKNIDASLHVVIFQGAAIGQEGHIRDENIILRGLKILYNYLCKFYDDEQPIILYEASQNPGTPSKIIRTKLRKLIENKINSKTTIYISPAHKKKLCKKSVHNIWSI